MNTLPVFFYNPTIICIDDDKLITESLASLLEKNYRTKTFVSANDFSNFITSYESSLSDVLFLRNFSESEFTDRALSSVIELKINKILELANDKNRYSEIAVVISDYIMPEISGYDLFKKVSTHNFKKFLLTGSEDYKTAIQAMNDKVIDCFVNKSDANLNQEILDKTEQLVFEYFNELTLTIKKHLETEYKLPLSDSIFADYFINFMKQNHIREYYLIDKNGSLLLIDNNDQKSVMIIHTERSLDEVLIFVDDDSNSKSIAEDISSRKFIPWFGIGNGPENIDPIEWRVNLFTPETILGKETYYIHHKML